MLKSGVSEQGSHLLIAFIVVVVIGLVGTLSYLFLNNLTQSSTDQGRNSTASQGALLKGVVSCADYRNQSSVVALESKDEYCLNLASLPEGWEVDKGYQPQGAQSSLTPAPARVVDGVRYYIEFALADNKEPTNYSVTSEHVEVVDKLSFKHGNVDIVKWKDNYQYVVSACGDNPGRPERASTPDEGGVYPSISQYGCYPSIDGASEGAGGQSSRYLSITLQRVEVPGLSAIFDSPYPAEIVNQFVSIVESLENK